MSVANISTTTRSTPSWSDDHVLADPAATPTRHDYACLVNVTHLRGSDARTLRLVAGVTGVIDVHDVADVHMIVAADSRRSAARRCVELVAARLPQAVVTVPEVVDYNAALLSFLDHHGEGQAVDDPTADLTFCDRAIVAEVLDRAL